MTAADFASGVIHWGADTWGRDDYPVIGRRLLVPFRVHHVNPDDLLRRRFVDANGDAAFLVIPVLIALGMLPLDHSWSVALETTEPTSFGSGFISGLLAAILGIAGFGLVSIVAVSAVLRIPFRSVLHRQLMQQGYPCAQRDPSSERDRGSTCSPVFTAHRPAQSRCASVPRGLRFSPRADRAGSRQRHRAATRPAPGAETPEAADTPRSRHARCARNTAKHARAMDLHRRCRSDTRHDPTRRISVAASASAARSCPLIQIRRLPVGIAPSRAVTTQGKERTGMLASIDAPDARGEAGGSDTVRYQATSAGFAADWA